MSTAAATDQSRTRRPPSGIRRWLPLVLVLAALLAVVVVARMKTPSSAAPPAELLPVNVEVQTVQPVAELPDTFELTAVVEPNRVVRVAAEVAGRIERWGERRQVVSWQGRELLPGTSLAEGEPLTAGEPLVYLNSELLQARFDRCQAQYEYDEREYRRILGLYEGGGSTSKTEVDDARTRRDVSKASLEEAEHELDRATIAAPCGGILNRLPMEVGEYASPGDVVAEIVDNEIVKVVVDVPERDVAYLAVGRPAEVQPRGDGEPLSGPISYIGAVADTVTRTTRVEITIDNRRGALHSGQIVRARLARRMLTDVIMIPLSSVIPLEHGKEVYVVVDDRAERREVELDFIQGREVRVLRGLAAGDRLIVTGHRQVGSGQPVRVVAEQ